MLGGTNVVWLSIKKFQRIFLQIDCLTKQDSENFIESNSECRWPEFQEIDKVPFVKWIGYGLKINFSMIPRIFLLLVIVDVQN